MAWSASDGGAPAAKAADASDPLRIRQAGRDPLSLALIEARNHTLRWLADDDGDLTVRRAAQVGWFQEYWIARNVQRSRGEAATGGGPRLGSIEPRIDSWLRADGPAVDPDDVRAFLGEVLDTTLDLLATAGDDDAALFVYRLCLLHEDRMAEAVAESNPVGAPPARAARPPLCFPAQCLWLGSEPGGLVPENERWAHEVAVPEFEIDSQAVGWGAFVEFADDGGYDRVELWSAAGWEWAQRQGRRAPARVDQLRGAVLALRDGRLQRLPPNQPVLHTSRFEAEAWCRWAGRRLPTEAEWELSALNGGARGFVWGDVFEWAGGSARPWPGHAPLPGALDAMPAPGAFGVLRGASWHTRPRLRHPKARRFAQPGRDTMFCGFRSCTL